jgi:DNA polymerase I-like protein with 3'-5' exonuclease and polymerase domains/5'-3' exonuclease
MSSQKKLVLIDGNALIHRGFHAFARADLRTPSGQPTGAVYGFAVMILNIYTKLKPDYIAVAFDTGKPTFRHEEYKEYKATRVAAPQDLYDQIPKIQELVETFNIPVFTKDGFEADDIIGTLSAQAPQSVDTYIATGDMDALQLVDDHTFVYAPGKSFADIVLYDLQLVKEKKGLTPLQFIDFKGLRGDASDNIPGVPGIGEVTATKLLTEYGSMEGIYENIDKITGRTHDLLVDNKKMAIQSKRLATILRDMPITLDLKKSEAVEFDSDKVRALFADLGFKSLINKIPNGTLTKESLQPSFFSSAQPQFREPGAGRKSYTEKLDADLEPVLRKMEKAGILLDINRLIKINSDITKRISKLEAAIHKHAKTKFNVNSPIQLSEVLYKKLNLPTLEISKTKTGYSTGVAELEKLYKKHPIIKYILEYRQLEKLRSTYLEPLPKLADKNGRVHTHYAQDTATGRLSSKDPNLQNIPIRSEEGAEIRKCFIAPKGFKLLSADYSQIELRVIASLAKDARMISIFKRGEDIHTAVAAAVNGVALSDVTKEMRRHAKVINFGIIYGVSPWGLAARTDMSLNQATEYIDKYFELHPHIKQYMKDIVAFAQEKGYVETLFGRKRYVPEINSKIPGVRNAAQRAAINMPIQGTAADIMKVAMIELDKLLPKTSKATRMLLTVHDELVFEVPDEDVDKVSKLVKTVMSNVFKLDVPIELGIEVGQDWGK